MDSNFFTQGSTNYQNALQEYTNTLSREKIDEEKVEKPVDEFNQKLAEVTEPIGSAIIHQPALDITKAGIKKILGKEGQKKALSAVQKLKGGDIRGAVSDGSDALTAARQGVSDQAEGLQRAVDRVNSGIEADNGGADGVSQGTFRRLLGKAGQAIKQKLGFSAEPETATPDDAAGRPTTVAELPEDEEIPQVELDQTQQRLYRLSPMGQNAAQEEIVTHPDFNLNTGDDPEAMAGNQKIIDNAITRQEQLEGFQHPGEPLGAPPPPPPEEVGPTAPPPPPPIASDAAEVGESDSSGLAALKSAAQTSKQLAKTAAKSAAKGLAEGAEGGLESALGTASEIADETAAAQGGADPFADVAAGAIGLASILAGVFGGKKEAAPPTGPEFIPSAQFGI